MKLITTKIKNKDAHFTILIPENTEWKLRNVLRNEKKKINYLTLKKKNMNFNHEMYTYYKEKKTFI